MAGKNNRYKKEEESLLRPSELTYNTFSKNTLASRSTLTTSSSHESSQASSSKMMPIMGSENFDALHHDDLNAQSASDEPAQYVKKDEKMPEVGVVRISSSHDAKVENEEITAQNIAAEKRLLRKIDLR